MCVSGYWQKSAANEHNADQRPPEDSGGRFYCHWYSPKDTQFSRGLF